MDKPVALQFVPDWRKATESELLMLKKPCHFPSYVPICGFVCEGIASTMIHSMGDRCLFGCQQGVVPRHIRGGHISQRVMLKSDAT